MTVSSNDDAGEEPQPLVPADRAHAEHDRRRQRRARLAVGAGLAGAAGLTVLALATAQGGAPPGEQPATATQSVVGGINGAGLAPVAAPTPDADATTTTGAPTP